MDIYNQWLGSCSYSDALLLQEQKVLGLSASTSKKTIYVLAGSHYPVVSSGLRSKGDSDFFYKKNLLKNNFLFISVKRGGAVTLHMPGQLVVYPILSLEVFNIELKVWVKFLITSFQDLIKNKYNILLTAKQDGLYFSDKKILFIGLRVKKRISYHGVALNINNDLEAFNWIKPCGHRNLRVTSLSKELGYDCSLEELHLEWLEYLKDFILSKTGLSSGEIKHIKNY